MSLKYFSSGFFCLAERNHLCNFGRGHYGEHSLIYEIILNLNLWSRLRKKLWTITIALLEHLVEVC